jgi:hypothetical protein
VGFLVAKQVWRRPAGEEIQVLLEGETSCRASRAPVLRRKRPPPPHPLRKVGSKTRHSRSEASGRSRWATRRQGRKTAEVTRLHVGGVQYRRGRRGPSWLGRNWWKGGEGGSRKGDDRDEKLIWPGATGGMLLRRSRHVERRECGRRSAQLGRAGSYRGKQLVLGDGRRPVGAKLRSLAKCEHCESARARAPRLKFLVGRSEEKA